MELYSKIAERLSEKELPETVDYMIPVVELHLRFIRKGMECGWDDGILAMFEREMSFQLEMWKVVKAKASEQKGEVTFVTVDEFDEDSRRP